jgi:chromosomal replication initiator protein
MDQENKVVPHNFLGTTEQFMRILPREVLNWLVQNTIKDMTVTETAAVMLVDLYNEESERGLSDLNERIRHIELKNSLPPDTLTKIVRTVEKFTMVDRKDIFSTKKKPHIYKARMLMAGLIREITPLSLMDMGHIFHRDHTTMLYTINRYEGQKKVDGQFLAMLNLLKEELADEIPNFNS